MPSNVSQAEFPNFECNENYYVHAATSTVRPVKDLYDASASTFCAPAGCAYSPAIAQC
jgi:hypothetical protein